MSKNVKINDTNYEGISYIYADTTDGGTATFKDVDEITTPTGTRAINENGTYDVTDVASVVVNVEAENTGIDLNEIVMGTGPSGDVVLDTATSIRGYTFMNLTGIVTFKAPNVTKVDLSAFMCSTANKTLELVELPKVQEIGNYAFQQRAGLTSLVFPVLTKIGNSAFAMCTGLRTVKFGTKLTSCGTNVFMNCTNLDIYVPWGEGEVSSFTVPSSGVTVHYNTVYDDNWGVISST